MHSSSYPLLLVGILVGLLGCPNEGTICDPGETQPCVCAGGESGGQECADDGQNWGACDCGGGDDDDAGDDDSTGDDDTADDDDSDGDDDTADDDDSDPTSCDVFGDDDDTSYVPPPDLAPWFEWDPYDVGGTVDRASEALSFVVPGFLYSLLEAMESLPDQYGDATCPAVVTVGPPDQLVTAVVKHLPSKNAGQACEA